ncbi:MAG: hypothetical protein VZR00_12110, partial [Lachnospiraceae bacterium]|nr:hypothetical protein [Lachnospiraceae bacterium]
YMKNLLTGEWRKLSDNQQGILKSYVYFDGIEGEGLGKASVCLDYIRENVYYIQDDNIMKASSDGKMIVLNTVPAGRMTAFTHVSQNGKKLCVPMTDGRILDFDPETEGYGLDKRPKYNIDGRVQDEHLNSYLCVYDTETGDLLYEKVIPLCWITHVQFNPSDSDIIMYNHEWSSFDCGIRRINIYDHHKDMFYHVRTEGADTLGDSRGYARSKEDWVCHEMWTDDGKTIIYHGGYANGPAMVGRCDIDFLRTDKDGLPERKFYEIALPDNYNAYGHFLMDHKGNLTCDGYYRMPGEKIIERENSTDNGPDPHRKDGAYITKVIPDWKNGKLKWIPLCRHDSDWLGQDAHPHPIYSHSGDRIFFNSRMEKTVNVYAVSARTPE